MFMKRAKGRFNKGSGKSTKRICIEVMTGGGVEWQVPLKFSAVSPVRIIPGGVVTKILCEQDIQLRLTRVVQSPVEQLGFCVA
jgi:predicted amino acid dehydrogenase